MPTKTIILDLNDRTLLTLVLPPSTKLNIYLDKKLIHKTEIETGESLELRLPYEFGDLKRLTITPHKTKITISARYPQTTIRYEILTPGGDRNAG
ncbi:MAG: hypothetical protein DRQ10_05825 [Candidatus Hydrothermota bacterium]|nr:MAG: hypothetical protein DRQ10_05825 [Candidatus Hydrothermae bacterium]